MSTLAKTHYERLNELTDKLEDTSEQAAASQAKAVMDFIRELAAENLKLAARVIRLEQEVEQLRG